MPIHGLAALEGLGTPVAPTMDGLWNMDVPVALVSLGELSALDLDEVLGAPVAATPTAAAVQDPMEDPAAVPAAARAAVHRGGPAGVVRPDRQPPSGEAPCQRLHHRCTVPPCTWETALGDLPRHFRNVYPHRENKAPFHERFELEFELEAVKCTIIKSPELQAVKERIICKVQAKRLRPTAPQSDSGLVTLILVVLSVSALGSKFGGGHGGAFGRPIGGAFGRPIGGAFGRRGGISHGGFGGRKGFGGGKAFGKGRFGRSLSYGSGVGRVSSGVGRVSSGVGRVSSGLGRVGSVHGGLGRVSSGLGRVGSVHGGLGRVSSGRVPVRSFAQGSRRYG
ncbi:hypothetical protein FJT64_015881 [Amphibalanus amphitrite]|uniref:Uncharacterized protein n=1 Tax=Amphibalanus amphitrite TaxID=1232801 RepID=A0A6A4X1N1_AMPAM|nr:hypothetical protein FJT64_015881 [Amphibalanus amphitrite]